MRAVIQRVTRASVKVEEEEIANIGLGMLILLGVGEEDAEEDARYIADKSANLRIFEDEQGKMNQSIQEIGGEILLVSQFTLYGDARKGRRPSFSHAAWPEKATALYEKTAEFLRAQRLSVKRGEFGADMDVSLVNQGPVTILLESRRLF